MDALREILLNALVHRTYVGASIQIRIYDDRMSVWNEGILPSGLTVDDLKVEHNSIPRNPKIAKTCFLAGYIDAWGRGISKIFNSCREFNLIEPEIKEMNGGIEVTLFNKSRKSESLKKPDDRFGRNSERIRKGICGSI